MPAVVAVMCAVPRADLQSAMSQGPAAGQAGRHFTRQWRVPLVVSGGRGLRVQGSTAQGATPVFISCRRQTLHSVCGMTLGR